MYIEVFFYFENKNTKVHKRAWIDILTTFTYVLKGRRNINKKSDVHSLGIP